MKNVHTHPAGEHIQWPGFETSTSEHKSRTCTKFWYSVFLRITAYYDRLTAGYLALIDCVVFVFVGLLLLSQYCPSAQSEQLFLLVFPYRIRTLHLN